jgi:hypothetical protein
LPDAANQIPHRVSPGGYGFLHLRQRQAWPHVLALRAARDNFLRVRVLSPQIKPPLNGALFLGIPAGGGLIDIYPSVASGLQNDITHGKLLFIVTIMITIFKKTSADPHVVKPSFYWTTRPS